MHQEAMTIRDSEELEALFDSIASRKKSSEPVRGARLPVQAQDAIVERIGRITRTLHDGLQQVGRENGATGSVPYIPNVYDRLSYIASLADQASESRFKATDKAQAVTEQVEVTARELTQEWDRMFEGKLDVDQFRQLANQTRAFLVELPAQTREINACLAEIMASRKSQALASVTILQVADMTQRLERQLLEILISNPPANADPMSYAELLERQAGSLAGREGVADDRDHVDALLGSFGF